MGTWDAGPFDNDTAADWCGDLQDADPVDRPAIIEQAFATILQEPGYVDHDIAAEAIAAAAILAGHRPGGPAIESPYAPDFLTEGGRLALDARLDGLALRALDRITAKESEWRELWDETGLLDAAVAELASIRAALGA